MNEIRGDSIKGRIQKITGLLKVRGRADGLVDGTTHKKHRDDSGAHHCRGCGGCGGGCKSHGRRHDDTKEGDSVA